MNHSKIDVYANILHSTSVIGSLSSSKLPLISVSGSRV